MSDPIASALGKFFDQAEYPILFTGAGVSAKAGLPTWPQLITKLAQHLGAKDPLTRQQMLECVARGDYTRPIDYYRMSNAIVEGDKNKFLVGLLSTYDVKELAALARLPFRSCLTTNFDRSILDAIAIEKKLRPKTIDSATYLFDKLNGTKDYLLVAFTGRWNCRTLSFFLMRSF